MSDIHLLGSIINDLENELAKYAKKKDASEYIIKARQHLIQQLSDVYDGYKHLTMWETFQQIQHDVDRLTEKDKELRNVIIVLSLKPGRFDACHCGFIDFTDRPDVIPKKPKTYLDEGF